MSKKECLYCNSIVSPKVKECPKCGHPQESEKRYLFYFRDADLLQDGNSPQIESADEIYFLKSTLFADGAVLPTTNAGLYITGLKYMDLFYEKISDTDATPLAGFLLEPGGGKNPYAAMIQRRLGQLLREKSINNNPERDVLIAKLETLLNVVAAHEEMLNGKIKPIEKEVPSSRLFKDYLYDDLIKKDHAHLTDEVKGILSVFVNDPNKTISTYNIISEIDKNCKVTPCQRKKIMEQVHHCFHNSNEKSIPTNAYRLYDFNKKHINLFFQLIGLGGEEINECLKSHPNFLLEIRKTEEFILLRDIARKALDVDQNDPEKIKKAATFFTALDDDYTPSMLAKWYKRFDWGERTGVSPATLHAYINLGLVSLPFPKELIRKIYMGGAGHLMRGDSFVDLEKMFEIKKEIKKHIDPFRTRIRELLVDCERSARWGYRYSDSKIGKLAQNLLTQTRRSE